MRGEQAAGERHGRAGVSQEKTEEPWGMTGRSSAAAIATIRLASVMPPHHVTSGWSTSTPASKSCLKP